MAATIKDVAKLANVAPSTVSRVIANSSRISEDTKRKVRKAMTQLGYHPNLNARGLASQSTQLIGLIMPSSSEVVFQNPFFPTVLQGINEGAHEKRYALHMTTGKSDEETLEGVVNMVQGKRVDGMILLNSKVEDAIIKYLKNRGFPFVLIGKPYTDMESITHVDTDNCLAMQEATDYLLKMGHQKIAFIGGSADLMVTVERFRGYKCALRNARIPLRTEYVKHEEFLIEGGQEAVRKLMSVMDPPTAIIVTDDFMALGVLKTLDELGIRVPEEISIISFNNVLLAEMAKPPLTSVDINIYELGYHAAKCLIERIENRDEPIKRMIIPHALVQRSSCSIPGHKIGLYANDI